VQALSTREARVLAHPILKKDLWEWAKETASKAGLSASAVLEASIEVLRHVLKDEDLSTQIYVELAKSNPKAAAVIVILRELMRTNK
jgi:hypothetical protein